jgi:hypothetical protein
MTATLYTIGGINMTRGEVGIFGRMLDTTDHTYVFGEHDTPLIRQCLDVLVLEGLIERFRSADDKWLDMWVVTDEAIGWLADPEVCADIELVKATLQLIGQA